MLKIIMSYVFYDLETSGTDPDFDQIFQIGIVTTDADMNVISKQSLRARRLPWVVPSPEALLITGLGQQQLEGEANSLFDILKVFEAAVKGQGAAVTTAGYNSAHFDEAGIRAALHQNLMDDTLLTAPGKTRLDVMLLVQACMIYKPGLLKLDDKTEKGNTSFMLGKVARQNGVELSEEDAHEAVADVIATIGLAKLIRDKAPDLWQQVMSLGSVEGVQNFLKKNKVFSFSKMEYGKPVTKNATVVTASGNDRGEQIMFDLSFDPVPYLEKSVNELVTAVKKKGKNVQNPFFTVRDDGLPILMPISMVPSALSKTDEETLEQRADIIRKHPHFSRRLAQAMVEIVRASPAQKITYLEKKINVPVPSSAVNDLDQWKAAFHKGTWQERLSLTETFNSQFSAALVASPDLKRFRDFGRRIIYANAPDVMSAEDRAAFDRAVLGRIQADERDSDLMTLPKARKVIREQREDLAKGETRFLKPGEESRLDDLQSYYNSIESRLKPPAP